MSDDAEPITIDAEDLARVLAILTVNIVFALDGENKKGSSREKLAVVANRIEELARKSTDPRNKQLFRELALALMRTELR